MYEFGIHIFIFIWNVETDNTLAIQVRTELGSEFSFVRLFHHKDDGGPFDLLCRQWD